MIDICAEKGWLITVIRIQQLMQCVVQGRWYDDSPVLCLPHVEELNIPRFKRIPVKYVQLRVSLTFFFSLFHLRKIEQSQKFQIVVIVFFLVFIKIEIQF